MWIENTKVQEGKIKVIFRKFSYHHLSKKVLINILQNIHLVFQTNLFDIHFHNLFLWSNGSGKSTVLNVINSKLD